MKSVKIRSAYHKDIRVVLDCTCDEPITEQSHKAGCEIKNILDKYQQTGIMTHVSKHQPQYGDVTPVEFQDAMNIIAKAGSMFEELPANIRKKFDNDPKSFLEFVQDEKNLPEMYELGLAIKPEEAPGASMPLSASMDQGQTSESASDGPEKAE